MAKNRDSFYFETFQPVRKFPGQAGHMLVGILRDFRPGKAGGVSGRDAQDRKQCGHEKARYAGQDLQKSLSLPIEREDIIDSEPAD